MKKIYIFRHGITEAVKNGHSYGKKVFTAEILPEAKPIIEHMSQYLKDIPDSLNLSSEFLRCQQTTKIVTEVTGKEFKTDPRLNEYAASFNELPHQFQKRIKSIYAEIEASTFEHIIICTHAAGIAALLKLISKSRWPWVLLRVVEPGVLIIADGKKLSQIDFNPTTA